jgi:CubicO group peptidase (beta-lactamase class C family)
MKLLSIAITLVGSLHVGICVVNAAEPAKESVVVSTGQVDENLTSFDRLMTEFMSKHDIPGASLAVTKDGRLVYARGYGYADVEAKRKVQPQSLFRIASISKPITAVAILQLVERKKLSLDDRMADVLRGTPPFKGTKKIAPQFAKVTIRQLLQHTGGWDRGVSFDPMFRLVDIAKTFEVPSPAKIEHIIRYMKPRPLDFTPGERFAYSNFGYCLLGRVIENVSGKSYETHVKQRVLAPVGIRSMQLGKTPLAGRARNEVRYYAAKNRTGKSILAKDAGNTVPLPYGVWDLGVMDSHGGWIASAVDLAKFASAFDDPSDSPLLKRESIETMFKRPPGKAGQEADGTAKGTYYGCGWMVRPVGENGLGNHWHTGSLDGTSTILVRRHDGLNWVVLFNRRAGYRTKHVASTIDPLVHKAADAVTNWPKRNLFSRYR